MRKPRRGAKKQGTRGPPPERLAIEGDWKGAVKRALGRGKPPVVGSRNARFLWRCRGCKRQFTVRVGTIIEERPCFPFGTGATPSGRLVRVRKGCLRSRSRARRASPTKPLCS